MKARLTRPSQPERGIPVGPSAPGPAPSPAAGPAGAVSPSKYAELSPHFVTLDPVTRIEGHLKIKVQLELVGNQHQVVNAWSTGTLFRGAEQILVNRHPWDAIPITQRICGVCPVSHGLAAAKALDAAAGVSIPTNARILRNLVLGANYVQSHILHFYHLAALDYITGPDMAPWQPAWNVDLRVDAETTATLIQHYLTALAMRRKAHEVGAIFGGRMPAPPAYVPGGFTNTVTASAKNNAATRLADLVDFIQSTYIPDVQALGAIYDDYFEIGRGPGNLLSYGVFDLNASGSQRLLARGRVENESTTVQTVDVSAISEDVRRSWYADSTSGLPPAAGQTTPQYPKAGAYSWLKAPRYAGAPYEVGALARMWVNGDYREGVSVMDRHVARALEALKVAQAMQTWVGQLQVGAAVYTPNSVPASATSYGLTEAPRGALGHWLQVTSSVISRYQVVTPTCWNASPRDDDGQRGPIEQALIGTPVEDPEQPLEVLRVIHSFDPCLSCAVHVLRADSDAGVIVRG